METEVVSSFFSQATIQNSSTTISDYFLYLVDELNDSLEQLKLPAAVHSVYNPTVYARVTLEMYIKKYCNSKKRIMYFGMNPGPWGMSQTGVPFGEVDSVKNWLQIHGPVGKPPQEIATRPVKGFECQRTEISGKRFWGLFKSVCDTPDKFFKSSFVYNYLPQQWMKDNGCNLTPGDFKVLVFSSCNDDLVSRRAASRQMFACTADICSRFQLGGGVKDNITLMVSEMKPLYSLCDPIFRKVIELYEVEIIVAIGKFCETRALKLIKKHFHSNTIQVLYMPHPSPRVVNNTDWHEKALNFLEKNNLLQYYK